MAKNFNAASHCIASPESPIIHQILRERHPQVTAGKCDNNSLFPVIFRMIKRLKNAEKNMCVCLAVVEDTKNHRSFPNRQIEGVNITVKIFENGRVSRSEMGKIDQSPFLR